MDKDKNLLSAIRIDSSSVDALKADGTISGGMIPKMETAAKVSYCSMYIYIVRHSYEFKSYHFVGRTRRGREGFHHRWES